MFKIFPCMQIYKVHGWKINESVHFERKFSSLFLAVRFFLKNERRGISKAHIEGLSPRQEQRLGEICERFKI